MNLNQNEPNWTNKEEEIRELLEARREYLKKLRTKLLRSLQKAPAGSLKISIKRGKPEYYHSDPEDTRHGGVYIKQDQMKLAEDLAQKKYEQTVLKAADQTLDAINRFLKILPAIPPEKVIHALPEVKKRLIVPIVQSDEEFVKEWKDQEFSQKSSWGTDQGLVTEQGETVRSKSELIIANLLYRLGIPYRYECALYLEGYGTVHPDFTILSVRNRTEIIWEHLGKMDDPDYARDNVKKIKAYQKNGYIPGKNLIITMETSESVLDIQTIKDLIENCCR